MKLKNNWKRFWTLNRTSSAGFTLVELIVVIAILAILAGVAIPVYSGYIKKAEEANDKECERILRTTGIAALISANYNQTEVDGFSFYIDENGKVSSEKQTQQTKGGSAPAHYVQDIALNITVDDTTKGEMLTKINEAFAIFFAGNEDMTFKNKKSEFIDVSATEEEDGSGETTKTVTFNGQSYNVNQSAIDNFKAATVFSDNVEDLQTQVNSLSGAFSDLVDENNKDAFAEAFGPDYAEFVKGLDPEEYGNATVLYVASKSGDITSQDIANKFLGYANALNNNSNLIDAMAGSDDMLTDSAMMYGALVAYVNSSKYNGTDEFKNNVKNVSSAADLLSVFQYASTDTTGFYNYVGKNNGDGTVDTSSQFDTDMNGFLGALDVIDTVSPGVDTGKENVWISDEVNDLLSGLLGSNG